jgi:hypothetical protein
VSARGGVISESSESRHTCNSRFSITVTNLSPDTRRKELKVDENTHGRDT